MLVDKDVFVKIQNCASTMICFEPEALRCAAY